MTSWLDWEISDDEGDNPFGKPGDFEFNIEYEFDPGDPGYMYDSNGDGYPGYQAHVTLVDAVCKKIHIVDQEKRTPNPEEAKELIRWFWTVLDKKPQIRDQLEERGLEQMTLEPDYDDRDD